MTTILGRLFGLYAIYRAWVGRPIKGRRRPRGFDAGWITSGAITAHKISANAITTASLSANAVMWKPVQFSGTWGNYDG